MSKNSKGFSFVEIIVSVSIIIMIASLAIPIGSKLHAERQRLSDRRLFAQLLHDELQLHLFERNHPLPANEMRTVRNRKLHFAFSKDKDYIKGCANWKNATQRQESICFYGFE